MILLKVIGSFVVGTTLVSSNPALPVVAPAPKETSWELVDQDEKITIYERWVSLEDGRKTRERKGVFYVDSEVDAVVPFVASAAGIKNWMNGVEESKELSVSQNNSQFIYLYFDAPWPFKNRDLVTNITTIQNCETPCVEVFFSAKSDFIPEKEDVIRLHSYEAHWQIIKTTTGRTQVTFSALSDTPPVAPKWIQDPVTAKMFKDNLVNLMELLTLND